jgi:hypothetical protein
MRSVVVGLVAAVLAAGLAPVSAFAKDKPAAGVGQGDAKSHQQGMAETPPLIQQTGISCSPTDANLVGVSKEKNAQGKEVNQKIYEVVCKEGLGWMILAPEGGAPQAFDCLALSANAPAAGEKDNGKLYCRLPPNQNPIQGLAPIITKAGLQCQPAQAQWMGSDPNNKFNQYEVACSTGMDYVLQVPEAGSSHALTAISCLDVAAGTCKFLPQDKRVALVAQLAAPANRSNCQVSDFRYMGTTSSNKNSYYEIACTDAKSGYVLQVDADNKYVAAIDCARATSIGGGCTLTSAVAAQTDEASTYNRLAKEIGLDCAVKSYHSFGIDQKSGREVVELSCSNRPDSIVTMMPVDKGQTGDYFNCIRAAGMGINCSLSDKAATYAQITKEIQASGKSCKVNNARYVGAGANGSSYVEVTCTGEPGLMLEYAPGPEKLASSMACLTARGIGGGCKLQ